MDVLTVWTGATENRTSAAPYLKQPVAEPAFGV